MPWTETLWETRCSSPRDRTRDRTLDHESSIHGHALEFFEVVLLHTHHWGWCPGHWRSSTVKAILEICKSELNGRLMNQRPNNAQFRLVGITTPQYGFLSQLFISLITFAQLQLHCAITCVCRRRQVSSRKCRRPLTRTVVQRWTRHRFSPHQWQCINHHHKQRIKKVKTAFSLFSFLFGTRRVKECRVWHKCTPLEVRTCRDEEKRTFARSIFGGSPVHTASAQ